jgi:hypothetical protein
MRTISEMILGDTRKGMNVDKLLPVLNKFRATKIHPPPPPLEPKALMAIQQKIGELEIALRNAFRHDFALLVMGNGHQLHPNK